MGRHITPLRLISAFVLACVISPAFAGFAAAAACPGGAMPCCAHKNAVPSVNAGCCRIERAPAPARTPAAPPILDRSVAMAAAPIAVTATFALATPALAAASRGPSSPGIPLYLALSALRR